MPIIRAWRPSPAVSNVFSHCLINARSGRILAVPDPLLEVRSPVATPRSPSPMAMAKNVVRDLAPDPPAESMHHGPHESEALLGRKDRDRPHG
jgi:hypothetical protein